MLSESEAYDLIFRNIPPIDEKKWFLGNQMGQSLISFIIVSFAINPLYTISLTK